MFLLLEFSAIFCIFLEENGLRNGSEAWNLNVGILLNETNPVSKSTYLNLVSAFISRKYSCKFRSLVLIIWISDLEPPRQRPQTSARTAQRLIAQSMGIRLPSTFGSNELRKQEEARKNRIVSRQNMREDAWGEDPN